MTVYTKCYSPIKGRVMRIVQLTECGVPVTGSSMIVHSGFTQVVSSAQYETGDEHLVKTADALLCINEKDADILKRFELTMTLCYINPALVSSVVSPARLLTASESPTGTGFALAEGAATGHFSLEVWQRVAGSAGCDASGAAQYVYNAWPHLYNGKIGDYTIAITPSELEVTAESKPVSTSWTIGDTWLGSGAVSVVEDHWFQNLTTATPPTAACQLQDLT